MGVRVKFVANHLRFSLCWPSFLKELKEAPLAFLLAELAAVDIERK